MKFSFWSKSCPNCKKKDSLRKFSFGYSDGTDYYCTNANCDYITSCNMEYEKAKQDYLTFGENNSETFKFYEYDNKKDSSSINFYSDKSKTDDPPTLPLGYSDKSKTDDPPTLPSSYDDSVQNNILCPNCSNQLIPFEHCYTYSPYDTTLEHRCSSCDYTTLMVGHDSIVKDLTEKPIKQKVDVAQKINEIRKEFDNNIIGHTVIKETILDIMNHQLLQDVGEIPKEKKKNHFLLVGAPGTSKTFFFESMFQCFPHYETDIIDCSSLSSSGLISYLLETKKYETLKYVCLDEIDKLDKEQSFILLSALERGILSEKKFKRNNTIDVSNIIFFATANDSKRIYPALKTRFLIFKVLPYTKEQFIQITTDLIRKKIPSYTEPSNIKRLVEILSNSYDKAPLNIREIKKMLTLVDPNDINDFEQYIQNFSSHAIMD